MNFGFREFWFVFFRISPAAELLEYEDVEALLYSKADWQFLHTKDFGLQVHALLLCPRLTRPVVVQVLSKLLVALVQTQLNVPGKEYKNLYYIIAYETEGFQIKVPMGKISLLYIQYHN